MITAYIDLMTQPSRALYMFLKHSKIPHKIVPVALRKGEQFSEEYTKINPFQKVPVVDEDSWILPESVSILQYLSDKYSINNMYPSDLKKRALVDVYTNWQHMEIRFAGAMLFHQLVNVTLMTGKPGSEVMIQECLTRFKASIGQIEDIFLRDTPYLYSDSLTIADLFGVAELNTPRLGLCVEINKVEYPKLSAWVERVRESVGSDIYDGAHEYITKAGQHFKSKGLPIPKLP